MPGLKRKEPVFGTRDLDAKVKKVKTDPIDTPKETVKQIKTEPPRDPSKETSRETHAKAKALARERKAAKPNADSIARTKKLWEQLRLKSHVDPAVRKPLVEELLDIVNGNVKDFVFKHDAVRAVQCAVKYATVAQKKEIARELKGQYTALAESRYAKFLVAKLLVEDKDTREMIVSEFYGHVRRLINHPEASWILDDTYRQVATPAQKAILLREWYGPEFAIFKDKMNGNMDSESADLTAILEANPEKRKPIMNYLFGLINQLVQKKLTGFTMLHDAMLQYSLAGEGLSTEFLDLLKPTEEGDEDLLKNLAFTPSGSRLVCRTLALTSAKDRKHILRAYKDSVPLLARDPNGVRILIAACEVVDDTVLTSKLIFPPLIASNTSPADDRYNALEELISDPVGRIALLYPFTSATPAIPKVKGKPPGTKNSTTNWLIPPTSPLTAIISELVSLRATTSKKDPMTRRQELQTALLRQSSHALITLIASRASSLTSTIFGCQFITEVLLSAPTLLSSSSSEKDAATEEMHSAMAAVADLAQGDPAAAEHISQSPAAGRMLKTLALGARYGDVKATNDDDGEGQHGKAATVAESTPASPPPHNHQTGDFATLLWAQIEPHAVAWATGSSSFVVANLLENHAFSGGDVDAGADTESKKGKGKGKGKGDMKRVLGGSKATKELRAASEKGNKGAGRCLELLLA